MLNRFPAAAALSLTLLLLSNSVFTADARASGSRCEVAKFTGKPAQGRTIPDTFWMAAHICAKRACDLALEGGPTSLYSFHWMPEAGHSYSGLVDGNCRFHPLFDPRSDSDLEKYADGSGSSLLVLRVLRPRELQAVPGLSENGPVGRIDWKANGITVWSERGLDPAGVVALADEYNRRLKAMPYDLKLHRMDLNELAVRAEKAKKSKAVTLPFRSEGSR